jgi:hypothetical protein
MYDGWDSEKTGGAPIEFLFTDLRDALFCLFVSVRVSAPTLTRTLILILNLLSFVFCVSVSTPSPTPLPLPLPLICSLFLLWVDLYAVTNTFTLTLNLFSFVFYVSVSAPYLLSDIMLEILRFSTEYMTVHVQILPILRF